MPMVPLQNGSYVRYCNLDSAASTLPFQSVCQAIEDYLPYYANVHRGHGYPSKLSSEYIDQCRDQVLHFIRADPNEFICIFGKNTTECINKLSWCFTSPSCLCSSSKPIILLSEMEHHSNMLPWRKNDKIQVEYIKILPDGKLDMEDAKHKLVKWKDKISIVSVSGASNVTGIVNPLSELSELAHQAGAYFCVDGAQLVPHRKVDMTRDKIDFLCFSGHKMYAPFGIGVLVGRKSFFNQHPPCLSGGGEVDMVTKSKIVWKSSPEKEEDGTLNITGIMALRETLSQLSRLGMDQVDNHEQTLYQYAYQKLSPLPFLTLLSPPPSDHPIGIFTFYIPTIPYHMVGDRLSKEFGIGTRTGCFCAHVYIESLLGISDEESQQIIDRVLSTQDRTWLPGLVRASFSLYTTPEDIDRLYDALVYIHSTHAKK